MAHRYPFLSAFPILIFCLKALLEQDVLRSVWLGCPCSLDCTPTKTKIDDRLDPLDAHRTTLLYIIVRCIRHRASQLSDVLLATATEPPQLPSKLMMTMQVQLPQDNHHHHHLHHLHHPRQQHHHHRRRRRRRRRHRHYH